MSRPVTQQSTPSYSRYNEDLEYQAELLRQQQQEDYEAFQTRMMEQNMERERIDRMRREGLIIEADEAEADFHHPNICLLNFSRPPKKRVTLGPSSLRVFALIDRIAFLSRDTGTPPAQRSGTQNSCV